MLILNMLQDTITVFAAVWSLMFIKSKKIINKTSFFAYLSKKA